MGSFLRIHGVIFTACARLIRKQEMPVPYVVYVVKVYTHVWSEKSEFLNCKRMGSGSDRVRKALYFSWNWHNDELNADGALAWQADGTNIVC